MNLDIITEKINSRFAKILQTGIETNFPDLSVWRRRTPYVMRNGNVRRHFSLIHSSLLKSKLQQMWAFQQHHLPHPAWCTQTSQIHTLPGPMIFARTHLHGSEGSGIIKFNKTDEQYPSASLYTTYIPKKYEFRVHVVNGRVIDVLQKKVRRNWDGPRDTNIRNTHNGYVFTRNLSVDLPVLNTLGIQACQALGYHYGGVDIIYNEHRNQCYILEVNSRPGIEGTTIINYSKAIYKTYF